MVKVKVSDVRKWDKPQLQTELKTLKEELARLRVAKVTSNVGSKLSQIKVVRKNIARVLTVANQTHKQELRVKFAKKKYQPLELRAKQTRAMRRRLSAAQANAKTSRALKKLQHFPPRVYAVKN